MARPRPPTRMRPARSTSRLAWPGESGDSLSEPATFGQFVHRLVEMLVGDPDRAVAVSVDGAEHGGVAEQLLDVCGARAFGPRDEPFEIGDIETKPAPVEREQSSACVSVRERQRNGEVDAAGPR